MDPHNSHVLFAGMWQVEMHTYGQNIAAGRAAEFTFRATAERSGRKLKATECRVRLWEKLTWQLRRQIPIECTR